MRSASRPLDEQLFGLAFHHSAESIFAVDRNSQRIIAGNRPFEMLTGHTVAVLRDRPLDELFAVANSAALFDRPGLHEDVALRRASMKPGVLTFTVAHLEHPELGPLATCIARDSTERRQLERELLAKHVSLHTAHIELQQAMASLAERNRELAALGAQLSQAARRALIGELTAGISHSLNNPLAALASAQRQLVEIVEQHGDPQLSEAIARFARRGRDAIGRMEQIIKAVHRAHQSGAPSSEARAIDIGEEVEVALSLFEPRLSGIW